MQQILSEDQLKQLFSKVSRQSFALRNYCMLNMMFIHGLRVPELLSLKYADVDLSEGTVWINRCNNGVSGLHPLTRQEKQLLSAWLRQRKHYADKQQTALFVTRHGEPWTRFGVMKVLRELSNGLPFEVNAVTLFNTCQQILETLPAKEQDIRSYFGRDVVKDKLPMMASLQRGFRRFDEACKPVIDRVIRGQNGPKCLLVWLMIFLFANVHGFKNY